MSGRISHFTDLIVYQKAFELSVRIFDLSQAWPKEERFALTDQVRRASRSIGAYLAEAWGKRRYEAHFLSKRSDSDAELHETEHWLLCASKHGYLRTEDRELLRGQIVEVGKMIGSMMKTPTPFLLRLSSSSSGSSSAR